MVVSHLVLPRGVVASWLHISLVPPWFMSLDVQACVEASPVVVFSETQCRYSKKAKSLLYAAGCFTFQVFEIDKRLTDGRAIKESLKILTGSATVPQVRIFGLLCHLLQVGPLLSFVLPWVLVSWGRRCLLVGDILEAVTTLPRSPSPESSRGYLQLQVSN